MSKCYTTSLDTLQTVIFLVRVCFFFCFFLFFFVLFFCFVSSSNVLLKVAVRYRPNAASSGWSYERDLSHRREKGDTPAGVVRISDHLSETSNIK